METYKEKEEASCIPVLCCRILQILDSQERFGVPYGTKSPFTFAFRDTEFRQPGNRSYRYYMALRRCKDIHEYRQQVRELYEDSTLDIDVNGEIYKFPIQMIPVSKKDQEILLETAKKNEFAGIADTQKPLVFLSTLPVPRLLASPPPGKYRREYLTDLLTNKIIDLAVLVPETALDLGIKTLAMEIAKYLVSVESTLAFISTFCQRLKTVIPKSVGISMRGTVADNPVLQEDALRIPGSCYNFWEVPRHRLWPTYDIDLDFFCGEEEFEEIYSILKDEALFIEVNADIKGLRISGQQIGHSFSHPGIERHLDIYLMSDEWVFKSVQRYLHLGLEQPWAYYYASSYPIVVENWNEFLDSLYKYIGVRL